MLNKCVERGMVSGEGKVEGMMNRKMGGGGRRFERRKEGGKRPIPRGDSQEQ